MTYEATEEGMLRMLRSKKPDMTVSPRITIISHSMWINRKLTEVSEQVGDLIQYFSKTNDFYK